MATKKKATKKKTKKRTPPLKFEDFSPQVQKSATFKVRHIKGEGAWRLENAAGKSLPTVPTKKKLKVQVVARVNSERRGWDKTYHPIKGFLKNVATALAEAEKQGAVDCKIRVSHYDGVKIFGHRQETDAEFQKRVQDVEVERATIVLARRLHKEMNKKEQEDSQKRKKTRRENSFKDAAAALTKKDIERLLKEVEEEKSAKKETKKAPTEKKRLLTMQGGLGGGFRTR